MQPAGQLWRTQFDAFAAAKTRQAVHATLPPYVTESEAPGKGLRTIGNDWTRPVFDGDFYLSQPRSPLRPACSLVFVQSADGNTEAPDPGSLGGGDTDKHLIYEGLSRVAADAVLAGAETVRGGNTIFSVWRPELVDLRSALGLPRHPAQIVATRRGMKIESSLLFNVADVPVIVLTVPAAANVMQEAASARPWITFMVMERADELPQAFERLRASGIATISCIGGRNLAGQLLAANLVDDVYLTTTPRAGGVPGTPLWSQPWRGRVIARKHGTGAETGVLFEHVVPATAGRGRLILAPVVTA
jgi:5-amino-6-(5-phosphoribosylamino)uracil reductase